MKPTPFPIKHALFSILLLLVSSGCTDIAAPSAPSPFTLLQSATATPSPTLTRATSTPLLSRTPTILIPTPAVTRSSTALVPSTNQPGLAIQGHVRLSDGSGVANVDIYRAFASYEGTVVATTDQAGFFKSEFQDIPGDEMVRVWAESPGFKFEPASKQSWSDGFYYWRHYYGHEDMTLDFLAQPGP